MKDQRDSQLLRAYAERRYEPAFAELVRRHVDLVYSAARRMVRDSHLAEDVTQGVFLALARNAARLGNRPVLSGWLHRTAQNIAAQTVRSDVRRRAREQEAAAMNDLLSAEPDAQWAHITPHLDAALGELNDPDRDALLLRYFERKSAMEMGQILGISDEAAQKRVSRAVERLRDYLTKRGVTVGASGLVVVLSANAVQAAPAGLVATISTAAAATVTTATLATHAAMNWLNIKSVTAIVSSAVIAATATHVVRHQEVARLRAENQELLSRQETLANERDNALAAAQATNDDADQLRRDQNELLRLRAEATQLRAQQAELAKLREQNQKLQRQAGSGPAPIQVSSPVSATSQEVLERDQCINNLRQIDGAMQQCALENGLHATNSVTAEQIVVYLRDQQIPRCPSGGTYTFGSLTNPPACSIPGHAISQ